MEMHQQQVADSSKKLPEYQQTVYIPLVARISTRLREEITKKFANKTLEELHEFVKQIKIN